LGLSGRHPIGNSASVGAAAGNRAYIRAYSPYNKWNVTKKAPKETREKRKHKINRRAKREKHRAHIRKLLVKVAPSLNDPIKHGGLENADIF
jgi:hypothetical protein